MMFLRPYDSLCCSGGFITLCLLLLMAPSFSLAYETTNGPGQETAAQQETVAEKKLSAAELETLLAPIALYSDDLLAQVLTASTVPLDVVKAGRYQELNEGVTSPPKQEQTTWEPSVVSLMLFPEVLKMMYDELDWTEQLGYALYSQETEVYETIQVLRHRAEKAGHLENDGKQIVVVEKEIIRIVPADPEIVYVPVYDPEIIYLPSSAVVYSSPAPWITYGFGISVGIGFSYAFDWHLQHLVHHYHWSRPAHHRHHYYRRYRPHYPNYYRGAWVPPPPVHRPGFRPHRPPHAGFRPPGYRPPRTPYPRSVSPGYIPRTQPRPPHGGRSGYRGSQQGGYSRYQPHPGQQGYRTVSPPRQLHSTPGRPPYRYGNQQPPSHGGPGRSTYGTVRPPLRPQPGSGGQRYQSAPPHRYQGGAGSPGHRGYQGGNRMVGGGGGPVMHHRR